MSARAVPALALARGRLPAVREAVAVASLTGMVGASTVLVGAAASGPSAFVRVSHDSGAVDFDYPGWLSGPLAGIGSKLTPASWIALSAVMYGLYLLVVALADSVHWQAAAATIGVVHLVFFLGPPLWLTDAYNYLGFARLGALHGLDPYAHALSAVRGDEVYAYSTWRNITSPYGPVFTAASYALAPAGVASGLWILKAVVAAASMGCVALVGRLAQSIGRRATPAMLIVGLNPLWLIYGLGGAHNDAIMMLVLLGGLLAALKGRETLGAGMVVAAAAVKISAGIALPFLWVASRQRTRTTVGAAVALLLVVALGAALFADAFSSALTAFLHQEHYVSLRSFPGQVTDSILERRTVSVELQHWAMASFAVVYVVLLIRTWRSGDWITNLGWAVLCLLLTLTWVMPWYVLWLLPFAGLSENSRLRRAALGLGLFLLVVRMPYPPIP